MQTPDYLWRPNHLLALLLWPVSLLFGTVAALRRLAYRIGLKRTARFPVPLIVVGNISLGGTGKTPLVITLVNHLRELGYKPGIVVRGYKGESDSWPQQVRADSDPKIVGDEPVVIARRTGCPVCADPDRSNAVQELLKHADIDLVLSDDGLQHYAMGRDIEIIVVDGERRLGNGFLLPAGPLREGKSRLKKADYVVVNGEPEVGEYGMKQKAWRCIHVQTGKSKLLTEFASETIHAVAGLGNPQRFFSLLSDAGIAYDEHVFPDHHHYTPSDLAFHDRRPVLMTEKDAVKCMPFANRQCWYLELDVELDDSLLEKLDEHIKRTRQ